MNEKSQIQDDHELLQAHIQNNPDTLKLEDGKLHVTKYIDEKTRDIAKRDIQGIKEGTNWKSTQTCGYLQARVPKVVHDAIENQLHEHGMIVGKTCTMDEFMDVYMRVVKLRYPDFLVWN